MYVNDAEFIQKVKREDICVDNVFLTMRNEYGPTICIYNTNGAGLSVSRSVVKAFRYVVRSVIVFAVAEALVLFRSTLKKEKTILKLIRYFNLYGNEPWCGLIVFVCGSAISHHGGDDHSAQQQNLCT